MDLQGCLERGYGKLLVLCSPAARKSPYVNDEVRRFARFKSAAEIEYLLQANQLAMQGIEKARAMLPEIYNWFQRGLRNRRPNSA